MTTLILSQFIDWSIGWLIENYIIVDDCTDPLGVDWLFFFVVPAYAFSLVLIFSLGKQLQLYLSNTECPRKHELNRIIYASLKWPFTISDKLDDALTVTSFHHWY